MHNIACGFQLLACKESCRLFILIKSLNLKWSADNLLSSIILSLDLLCITILFVTVLTVGSNEGAIP
jgi:hypothetical protein